MKTASCKVRSLCRRVGGHNVKSHFSHFVYVDKLQRNGQEPIGAISLCSIEEMKRCRERRSRLPNKKGGQQNNAVAQPRCCVAKGEQKSSCPRHRPSRQLRSMVHGPLRTTERYVSGTGFFLEQQAPEASDTRHDCKWRFNYRLVANLNKTLAKWWLK